MLDWDDLRVYLALVRHGSLSAAAQELHVAQSTVGRRLATLEASLGIRLVNRTPDGYVMTEAGESVRDKAERIEAETQSLERSIGGQDARIAGLVRVTCAETVANHILAAEFASLRRQHPGILVELIPDPRKLSLSKREADISVRLKMPEQHDLLVRRVGSLAFGLYASPTYLDVHGSPNFAEGCSGHCIVAQLNDIEDAPQMDWFTELTSGAQTVFTTSSHEAALSAAEQGVGLACLACFRADRSAGLLRLDVPTAVPSAEIWLTVHKDNRDNARIRAVLSHITEALKTLQPRLIAEAGRDGLEVSPEQGATEDQA